MNTNRLTVILLNTGHALDHMFLLIFAASVASIANDFGFARWEDLMPYSAGAFLMFGVGSVPAGRLGDLWGRRAMMIIFFAGLGASSILVALTQNAWQMAAALVVLGAFSAIYHPVGIPMLVRDAKKPGATLGVSGLSGNLGIALAALTTGILVKLGGWRLAFFIPGIMCIVMAYVFSRAAPHEDAAPAKRKAGKRNIPRGVLARVFFVVTATAITGSLLFNFTTNGNGELMRERFIGVVSDPVQLGILLAVVYSVGAFSQLLVGNLIDRFALKPLFLTVLLLQPPMFLLAVNAEGWLFFIAAMGYMISVFAAIPFTDALIVRYVDDSNRSRVAGMRLAVSFGVSSAAVWMLGPVVKSSGFGFLLTSMAIIAVLTWCFAAMLPSSKQVGIAHAPVAPAES